jgi:hypothetical protein
MATRKPKKTGSAKKPVLHKTDKTAQTMSDRAEKAKEKARQQTIKTAKSAIKLQKKAFDSVFKLIGQLQDQSEKAVKGTVNQSDWIPKEGKTVVGEWIKTLHGGRVAFQETVDKSFGLVAQFLNRVESEKTTKVPAKKAPVKKTTAKKKPVKKA